MNNKRKFKIYYFALLIFFINASMSFSQTIHSEKIIQEIIDAYNNFDYQNAEKKALAALDNYSNFSPEQLLTIHEYLAFINFTKKNYENAKNHFRSALTLNPDLTLSPRIASPKIIDFFNEVKQQTITNNVSDGFIRYVYVPDRRFNAAYRSALLPGWGQNYKGEHLKGRVLLSLWTANIVGILFFHYKQAQAHQDYLDETAINRIESKYNTYNRYFKTRNALLLSASLIWIYSYLDALITKEKLPTQQTNGIKVSGLFSGQKQAGISFSISW